MIPFKCPHCGTAVSIPDYMAGKKTVCTWCKKPGNVPAASAEPDDSPSKPSRSRAAVLLATATGVIAVAAVTIGTVVLSKPVPATESAPVAMRPVPTLPTPPTATDPAPPETRATPTTKSGGDPKPPEPKKTDPPASVSFDDKFQVFLEDAGTLISFLESREGEAGLDHSRYQSKRNKVLDSFDRLQLPPDDRRAKLSQDAETIHKYLKTVVDPCYRGIVRSREESEKATDAKARNRAIGLIVSYRRQLADHTKELRTHFAGMQEAFGKLTAKP